jgi:hypothetical protein
VGLLDWLGLSTRRYTALSSSSVGVLSQYADTSGLGTIVISDALGVQLANLPIDRGAAMSVPSVAKGRNLLVSTVAKFPLVALDATGPLQNDKQPSFLYRTNTAQSPYSRMVCTVDDLIFHGVSLWVTTRGAAGQVLDAEWIPRDVWSVKDGKFYLDGRITPLDESEMILFDVPLFDGLLAIGASNLRGAKDVEKAWHGRARNPIPVMVLKVTDDSQLTQEEVDEYVEAWSAARKSENGAVGFLPKGIDMDVHGEVSPDLMLQGRNAVKTDVANYLNIPTTLLDGTLQEASLTYTTTEGNRNLFYDLSLPFWVDPITQRLSQDDIVPRGTRVRFDFYEQYAPTPSPTGPMELD